MSEPMTDAAALVGLAVLILALIAAGCWVLLRHPPDDPDDPDPHAAEWLDRWHREDRNP